MIEIKIKRSTEEKEEEKGNPSKTIRDEIALIASVITIFVFATGISSYRLLHEKLSSTPEPVYTPRSYTPSGQTPLPQSSTPEITPTLTLEITPAPTTETTPQVVPGVKDMQGCNPNVMVPDENSWLPSYEYKVIRTTLGNCAYLRFTPNLKDGHFGRVDEGTPVTVLARQDGGSLIKVKDGVVGWVGSNLLDIS